MTMASAAGRPLNPFDVSQDVVQTGSLLVSQVLRNLVGVGATGQAGVVGRHDLRPVPDHAAGERDGEGTAVDAGDRDFAGRDGREGLQRGLAGLRGRSQSMCGSLL